MPILLHLIPKKFYLSWAQKSHLPFLFHSLPRALYAHDYLVADVPKWLTWTGVRVARAGKGQS